MGLSVTYLRERFHQRDCPVVLVLLLGRVDHLVHVATRVLEPVHLVLIDHDLVVVWNDSLGVDTSRTAMQARTLKDLEHCNACVGLAVNVLDLAGNGKPELQATAIRSRFSG